MAAEIKAHYASGSTLYAVVLRGSDGKVYNGATFEALLAAHWTTYAVALVEQSTTGICYGTMPSVAAGLYDVWVYLQAGGSAATTDALLGTAALDWNGSIDQVLSSAVAVVASVSGAVASVTGAVASVTAGVTLAASQHVIVDSGTVTTLTNLPAIPANWLTAAGIAAAALNGKGDWSTYAGGDTSGTTTLLARLTATRAGYLDNLSGGAVALASALPANFAALGITAGGKVSEVVLVDTLTTYTGNTVQTGDSYALLGTAGAGLTALGDARLAHLDADVSSRLATAGYTVPLSAAGTRSAVGLAAANLDTQLAGIDADVLTRSTYAGGDTSGTTTLLGRLTAARAGYLDHLASGDAYSQLNALIGAPLVMTAGKVWALDGSGNALAPASGVAVAATGLDAVLVAGQTLPKALQIIGATVAGALSGSETGTEVFADFAGATAVTVTVDTAGNRTVVYA